MSEEAGRWSDTGVSIPKNVEKNIEKNIEKNADNIER
jgi:hypothetical protein